MLRYSWISFWWMHFWRNSERCHASIQLSCVKKTRSDLKVLSAGGEAPPVHSDWLKNMTAWWHDVFTGCKHQITDIQHKQNQKCAKVKKISASNVCFLDFSSAAFKCYKSNSIHASPWGRFLRPWKAEFQLTRTIFRVTAVLHLMYENGSGDSPELASIIEILIYMTCAGETRQFGHSWAARISQVSHRKRQHGEEMRETWCLLHECTKTSDTCAREWMGLLFGKHADRWHSRQRRSSVERWWWWWAGPPGRRAARLMDSLDMGCCQYMSRSVVHHLRVVLDMLQITAELIKMGIWDTWSVGES